MKLIGLTWKSMRARRTTVVLTVLTIAVGFSLITGVEKIRTGIIESFSRTLVGTDLIISTRTSSVQTLLYSVFRIGEAPRNISWESYEELASDPAVGWAVPISLGDSHRGFRVMGTTEDYFEYYRYGNHLNPEFSDGERFNHVFEAVIGSAVAEELGYIKGDLITLTHGVEAGAHEGGDNSHDDKPFKVVGILKATGTPVDRTVHIPLEGITAIHLDWTKGRMPLPEEKISAEDALKADLTPSSITAVFIGLKSKMGIFGYRQKVEEYPYEALSAVLPGIAFQQLWDILGAVDKALKGISFAAVVGSFLMMLTGILTSLNARRREAAIFRSIGLKAKDVFTLFLTEALVVTVLGCLAGFVLLYLLSVTGSFITFKLFGVYFYYQILPSFEILTFLGFIVLGTISGLIPAIKSYQNTLTDGLTIHF